MTSSQFSSSSEPDVDEFRPRAFLVRGLPPDDTTITTNGKNLHELIRKFVLPPSSTANQFYNHYQLFFDRTVHRKIRDGSFLILFNKAEDAQQNYEFLQAKYDNRDKARELILIPQIPLSFLLPISQQQQQNSEEEEDQEEGKSSSEIKITFSLAVSWSAGKLRDHFFPLIPFSLRRTLQLDPTATFSLTDQYSSIRMAKILSSEVLLMKMNNGNANNKEQKDNVITRRSTKICDAFACVGGNTLGFLSAPSSASSDEEGKEITAIELDGKRCEMLQKNFELLQKGNVFNNNNTDDTKKKTLNIHNGCALEFLATSSKNKLFDVVFFDPPWGGPSDMKEQENNDDHEKKNNHQHGFPKFKVKSQEVFNFFNRHQQNNGEKESDKTDDKNSSSYELSFEDVVISLVLPHDDEAKKNIASIIAIKLPSEKWCEERWMQDLVKTCVLSSSETNKDNRERTFPFLFNFGASVRLLCFVQNSIQIPSVGIACNKTLDELVSRIMKFHFQFDREGSGGNRELKPRYYDFEKKRWIDLKKWLGSKE